MCSELFACVVALPSNLLHRRLPMPEDQCCLVVDVSNSTFDSQVPAQFQQPASEQLSASATRGRWSADETMRISLGLMRALCMAGQAAGVQHALMTPTKKQFKRFQVAGMQLNEVCTLAGYFVQPGTSRVVLHATAPTACSCVVQQQHRCKHSNTHTSFASA